MSFYHVLANNVSPDVFPNNNAAMFSTPLEHPYDMTGKYEVSLMNMTYTGCVNTFDNDVMTITVPYTLKRLNDTRAPVRFDLDKSWTIDKLVRNAGKLFQDIVEMRYERDELVTDKRVIMWRISSKFCLVLSPRMKSLLRCNSSVITSWDLLPTTSVDVDVKTVLGEEAYILFVPLNGESTTIPIKEANEMISLEEAIRRFNSRVDMAHIDDDKAQLIEGTEKLDQHHIILLSPALLTFFLYPHAGMGHNDAQGYLQIFNLNSRDFKEEYYVKVIHLKNIQSWHNKLVRSITLPPQSFKQARDVVPYLTSMINDSAFEFTCDRHNYLTLRIRHKEAGIHFSDTLRDIFAFDKNEYKAVGKIRASDVISLTRRIHYLYIYTNISDYVRVGNTEAPLLAVIPFETGNSCNNLVEKNFAVPMYVRVTRDYISQIDIYIYDGSGKRVPFVDQAVTSLRLHYRRL